ncbi:hypothetical protein EP7_003784 [Isosphaeraceae bacterium EP7]
MPEQEAAVNTQAMPTGQRLGCTKCGSEIEIIVPCTCKPPDQKLSCCGRPMSRLTGNSIHVSVE